MTLKETINKFLKIAKKQPNINFASEGDIYTLNTMKNLEYSVFFVTQQQHQQSEDTITYNLILYYIDRLVEDDANMLDIQSNGIIMLGNIINTFINENDADINYDITYQPFTHKFADKCAGVYANVKIEVGNNIGVCNF